MTAGRPGSRPLTVLTVLLVVSASLLLAVLLKDRNTAATSDEGQAEERWEGMDELVVEAYASENGREARGPVLPLEDGDLLLFLFCMGGFLGGCVVGYAWKKIFSEGNGSRSKVDHADGV